MATAQTIITQAQYVLVDTGTRWTSAELLEWVNAGVRAIAEHRPDATNLVAVLTLVAGTKQSLPTGGLALLDVMRNVGGRAIRQTSMGTLDAVAPDWHTATAAATENYCYDPRTPRVFWVYPPAVADAQVEAKYQAAPSAMTATTDTVPLNDMYLNALLDYTLYRAFTKDAEFNATADRAKMHLAAFEQATGAKVQADAASAPQPTVDV